MPERFNSFPLGCLLCVNTVSLFCAEQFLSYLRAFFQDDWVFVSAVVVVGGGVYINNMHSGVKPHQRWYSGSRQMLSSWGKELTSSLLSSALLKMDY